MLVELHRPDGWTASGIVLEHHRLLMTPYGRVTHVHPECRYRVGDFIVFNRYDPQEMPYDKQKPYHLWDWQVKAVLTKNDGTPWFKEKVECQSMS